MGQRKKKKGLYILLRFNSSGQKLMAAQSLSPSLSLATIILCVLISACMCESVV